MFIGNVNTNKLKEKKNSKGKSSVLKLSFLFLSLVQSDQFSPNVPLV